MRIGESISGRQTKSAGEASRDFTVPVEDTLPAPARRKFVLLTVLIVSIAAAVLSVGRVAIGVHYPSDVVAGAVLGCLAALLLFARPLRDRIDRLSDLLGGWYEAALRRVGLVGRGRPTSARTGSSTR